MRVTSSPEASSEELVLSELPDWVETADKFIQGSVDPEYLVDRLIEPGTLIVLQGEPGCGKTWVALELVGAIARGRPAFGLFPARKRPILLIEEEGAVIRLRQRLRSLDLGTRNLVMAFRQGVRLDDPEWRARIEAFLRAQPFGVVVFDPLTDLLQGDENSTRDMAQVVGFAQTLISKFQPLAVLIVHHVQKQAYGTRRGSLKHGRGSGRLGGSADAVFEVLRRSRKGAKVIVMDCENVKSRSEVQPLLHMVLDLRDEQRATWTVEERDSEASAAEDGASEIREQILAATKAGQRFKSASEAVKTIHLRKRDVLAAWKELLDEGALVFNEATGTYVIGSGNQSGTTMASGSGNHVGTEAPGSGSGVPAPLGAEPAPSSNPERRGGKAGSRKGKGASHG